MAQLGRFEKEVQNTTGDAVSGASVTIYREGATVNGNQSGTTPLTVTVRHPGKIAAADTVFINTTTGTSYTVNSVTATTVVLSGFVGTLALTSGDRIIPSNSQPTLYGDDQGGATTANPLTSSSTGRAQCWAETNIVDYIVSGGGATTTAFTSQLVGDFVSAEFNVKTYGATGDGTTDDATAIQLALNDANAGSDGSRSGVVFLPGGTYIVNSKITVPTKVIMRGAGRSATMIKAGGTFPNSTPLVQLGDGTVLAFGCRVDDMTLNCNSVTGSIGIKSTDINEMSGGHRVLVSNYMNRGIDIQDNGAQVPDHFTFEDCEIYCSASATGSDGVYFNGSKRGGTLRRCTVNPNGTPADQANGVNIIGSVAGGGGLQIYGLNVERHTDGIEVGTNGVLKADGITLLTSGTNIVNITSTQPVSLTHLYRGVGTNAVVNTTVGNITASRVQYYFCSDSPADGYQVFTSAGTSGTHGNIRSSSQPMFSIASSSVAGDGNARVHIDMRDGNGDGWRLTSDPSDTRDSLNLQPINVGVVATALYKFGDTGAFTITDGIANPSVLAGFAQIYVDTADGDLKIIFGDGTVKTIVVDT